MVNKILAIILTSVIIFSWTLTFAQQLTDNDKDFNQQSQGKNKQTMGGQGNKMPYHPPRHPGDLIGKFIHDNADAEVLASLTGQSIETIKSNMMGKNMKDVLASYGIEEETFKKAMDAKILETAQKALQCGLITQDQLTELRQKIEQHSSDSSTEPNAL